MFDFRNYPFIDVSFHFYFCIHNADKFGGKGSIGYADNTQSHIDVAALTPEKIGSVLQAVANTFDVTVNDVEFITEHEYFDALRTSNSVDNCYCHIEGSILGIDADIAADMSDARLLNRDIDSALDDLEKAMKRKKSND